MYNYY